MPDTRTIGFIGLGVMGEPICRNLVKKSGADVIVFDLAPEPLARLRAEGASVAGSVAEIVNKGDIVFLCLPSAKHARAVFEGDGILKNVRKGQVIVDLGTSSVNQTRDFASQLQAKGAVWADAPIARTRQAAQDGTLSVMVGATPELYATIEPLIRCFATDAAKSAPSAFNRASGSRARSNATTRAPLFLTRLRQIGSPITPRPIKPMVLWCGICALAVT